MMLFVASAGRRLVTRLSRSAAGLIGRQPLNDPVSGQHAPVDREVSAHHKGPHGGVLLSQHVRLVCEVRLILAAVHKNKAGVAVRVSVALVHGVPPTASTAKAYSISGQH